MNQNSRMTKMVSSMAVVMVGVGMLLFASENATSQTHGGYGAQVWQQPHRIPNWHHVTPAVSYKQVHNPFAHLEPTRPDDQYRANQGQYGATHYGPVEGVYGSHYGYYGQPNIRWYSHPNK